MFNLFSRECSVYVWHPYQDAQYVCNRWTLICIGTFTTWALSLFTLAKHCPILTLTSQASHDDVIKWKHFPRHWPFVRGIHRSPVNSPHKGQWHRALIFSLICAWTKSWANNGDASDLRRQCAHYDVIVMTRARKYVPRCFAEVSHSILELITAMCLSCL